jgi:hypothetical protein
MERHDEEKPDFLFPQPAFDRTDQGLADALPVMVQVDAQPKDLRTDGAVPFQQRQTDRPAADPRNPSFQNFRLLGVVAVGFGLGEPFRQARRQGFQNAASEHRILFLGNRDFHGAIHCRQADARYRTPVTPSEARGLCCG